MQQESVPASCSYRNPVKQSVIVDEADINMFQGTINLVVFDMAGTTVRDNGEVVSAFSSALALHGVKVDSSQVNRVRGSSKRQAILELLPEDPDRARQAELVYRSFVEILADTYARNGVHAVEGAEEVFEDLKSRGIRIALNTGFDREITNLLSDALRWNEGKVDTVVCGDDVAQGRPAPDLILQSMKATGVGNPDEVANVGDTVLDLRAGDNAGVKWNIGVLSGAHDQAQLEQFPHTHILSSVRDLLDLWKEC